MSIAALIISIVSLVVSGFFSLWALVYARRADAPDEHREQARQLRAQGMSYAQIAEEVCGDRRCRQTVGTWLRRATVAGNGDRPVAH